MAVRLLQVQGLKKLKKVRLNVMFVRKKIIEEFKTKILSLEEGLHKQRIKTDKQQEIIDFLAKYGKDYIKIEYSRYMTFLPHSRTCTALLLYEGELKSIKLETLICRNMEVVYNEENHFVVKIDENSYYKINKDSGGYVEVTEFYKTDEKTDAHPTEKSDETT